MTFSIIVPIYKIEPYLRKCIESVLEQSCNDYELILVDDGSPDNCPSICDEYASKNAKVIVVHKQNGGLVSARKAGLEKANGKFAICLDGDDFLHPECLRRIMPIVNEYNPDVICYGFITYSEKYEHLYPVYCEHFGYYSRTDIENKIFPKLIYTKNGKKLAQVVWSKVFKMDIYRKYQNKVSNLIGMGEDYACTYPIICNCQSMYIMEDCLYYYRQISTSMTKVNKPLLWDNYDRIFRIINEEIDIQNEILKKQLDRLRTHNLFNICMSQFYSNQSYVNIVKQIKDRFRMHPEYDNAINNSDFNSMNMILVRFVLKNRIYSILYLYSRFRGLIKRMGFFISRKKSVGSSTKLVSDTSSI